MIHIKPTYTSTDLNDYLLSKAGVPAVELENVIQNPNLVEGFTFEVRDIKTTVVVYETIDHDGLNDDEIECVIVIEPQDVRRRAVLTEKYIR